MAYCTEVLIDSVDFKNGANIVRAATCLAIHNAKTARVMNCDFQIGHLQQGILLADVQNSMVQNNTLSNYRSKVIHHSTNFADIITAEAAAVFFSDLTREQRNKIAKRVRVKGVLEEINPTPVVRKEIKNFTPIIELQGISKILAKEERPKSQSFEDWGRNRVREILLNPAPYIKADPKFGEYYLELTNQDETVAAQAITVGGTVAEHVHISNNVISGVLVGIHVGVSNHALRDAHDFCKSVTIADNTIKIKLPLIGNKRTRHGIFAGNCKKMSIENNYITLLRYRATAKIKIDGIRAWGLFGPSLKVMHNVVMGEEGNTGIPNHFSQGIHIQPLNPFDPNTNQWVAMWNVAPSIEGNNAVGTDINAIDLRIQTHANGTPTNIPVS